MEFINFIIKTIAFVAMLIVFALMLAVKICVAVIQTLANAKTDYNRSRDLFSSIRK